MCPHSGDWHLEVKVAEDAAYVFLLLDSHVYYPIHDVSTAPSSISVALSVLLGLYFFHRGIYAQHYAEITT